jgi:hypothetical protein
MVYLEPIKTNIITKKRTAYTQYASMQNRYFRESNSHISLTSIYTIFLFQISFMSRNAKIISVPGYSFISGESGLLFSRSSTQTCDLLSLSFSKKHEMSVAQPE